MKTKQVSDVYNILNSEHNSAKLTKMEDKDKYLVIKAIRQMKPVATAYQEFVKDAQEKLKDEQFNANVEKAKKWQEEGEKSTLTMEERMELNAYFNAYNKRVDECVKEEAGKDVEMTYERLSDDAFLKLLSSNDFDVNTIMLLNEALCQEA